jgi:hypothetical protein
MQEILGFSYDTTNGQYYYDETLNEENCFDTSKIDKMGLTKYTDESS